MSNEQEERGLAVTCSVNVEQPANHLLLLGAVLSRFFLEEVDAGFAQSDVYFDASWLNGSS